MPGWSWPAANDPHPKETDHGNCTATFTAAPAARSSRARGPDRPEEAKEAEGMTGSVLMCGLVVPVAILAWALQLFLIIAAFAVAGRWGDRRHLLMAAVFGLQACVNIVSTLEGQPASIPLNFAMDALPFAWLVTREEFGPRLMALPMLAGVVLHFSQWVQPLDPWAHWVPWLVIDYVQVVALIAWAFTPSAARTSAAA